MSESFLYLPGSFFGHQLIPVAHDDKKCSIENYTVVIEADIALCCRMKEFKHSGGF